MDGNSNNPPGGGGGGSTGIHTPPNLKQDPPDDATLVLPRPPANLSSDGTSSLSTTLTVPQPHLTTSGSLGSGQGLPDGLSPRKKPRKQQL